MGFLTREQVVAAQGRRFAEVECAELGGKLRIATPSAVDAIRIARFQPLMGRMTADLASVSPDEMGQLIRTLLRALVVDESGRKLFQSDEQAQEAVDVVTTDTLFALIGAIAELKGGKKSEAPEAADGNPSEASPSAA